MEISPKGLVKISVVVGSLILICSQLLSANQKKWLLIRTGIEQPVMVSEVRPRPKPPASVSGHKVANRTHHANPGLQQYRCLKPETEAITTTTVNQVFSWTDANGKRHFSDQPPVNLASDDLSERYKGEARFFDLQITSPDGALVPLLKEQLSRDVTAIYRYLSDQLGLGHLRKVNVVLKVFHQPVNYQAYQRKHAPGLEGSAGFYSVLSNEAVVLQQSNREITRQIARHEATHVIMAGLYGLTPIWLNEGLAEAFSDYRNIALSRQFYAQPARLQRLREMLVSNTLPDLKKFLGTQPRQWQSADPAMMYPTAWALVKFMLEDSNAGKVLLAILAQLAVNPCSEIKGHELIDEVFPGGTMAFEEQWLQWMSTVAA